MDIFKKTFVIEVLLLFVLLMVFGGPVGGIFDSQINLIDEGQFGAWAYQMLQGKKLYLDIYSTYGPLYTYPQYVLFVIFGPDPFLVRIYLLFGSFIGGLSTLYISYKLGLRQIFRYSLIIMLGILPIITLRQGVGLLSLAFFVEALEKKSQHLAFISGLSTAMSFVISPEIAFFAFATQVSLLFIRFLSIKHILYDIRIIFAYVTGILFVWIPFAVASHLDGWFDAYVITTVDVFKSFSGVNIPNGMNFPSLEHMLFGNATMFEFIESVTSQGAMLYWVLVFYMGSFFFLISRWIGNKWQRLDTWICALSIFGMLLYTVVLSRPGIGHIYFILPPIILLLFVYMQKLIDPVVSTSREEKIVSWLLLTVIGVFFLRLFMIYRIEIFESVSDMYFYTHRQNIPGYNTTFHINDNQRADLQFMVFLVKKYSASSDSIFFLSDNPMMYLLTEKKNPTRYDLPYIANSKEKRFEVVSDLRLKKPTLILYDTTVWEVDGISNKKRLPEVYTYILEQYSLISTQSGINVYKLNK